MPRSIGKRDGSTRSIKMVSVETQTEGNDFCLCFVPVYKCKSNEEQVILDPRISADLNDVDWESEDGKIFVRNFEVNPKRKPTAKQRWRISGKTIRAVGKFRGQRKYLDVTLTDPDTSESVSGLYIRDLKNEDENLPRSRVWSITDASTYRNDSYGGDHDDDHGDFLYAENGSGKHYTPEPQRTEENRIIENIINECMRESQRPNKNQREPKRPSEKERKHNHSRDELDNSYERNKSSKRSSRSNGGHRRPPSYDEERRENQNGTSSQSSGSRRIKRPSRGDGNSVNSRNNEGKRRESPQKLLGYLEKSDKHNPRSSRKSLRSDIDNNSDHGSSYSAFAIVPGTDLQRKLSQRGINDKASLNIIKDSIKIEKNERRRNVRSAADIRHEHNRQSFHSVDNIFASSVSSRQDDKFYSSQRHSQMQSSFSADDIIDECMFKPLNSPLQQQRMANAPPVYAVTSTPRGTLENNKAQDDGFATYV